MQPVQTYTRKDHALAIWTVFMTLVAGLILLLSSNFIGGVYTAVGGFLK
ncbi:hypothetical protein [Compostibacter hankyongensis]|uniref:Uncharacterized protein n=1 Tax=Compostibacter hankyongensis TaxID=1007089 RepID=A0ABP8FL11_9BACT